MHVDIACLLVMTNTTIPLDSNVKSHVHVVNVKRVKNVRRARYTRETALIFRLNIKLQEIQPSLYSFYPLQLIWLY